MILDLIRIGLQVKEARQYKQMSQAELAESINLSVSYVSYIETGSKQVSLESLIRMANVLGVTVDYLLTGTQTHDTLTYFTEASRLLSDCNPYERNIILETMSSLRRSLRNNNCMITNVANELHSY